MKSTKTILSITYLLLVITSIFFAMPVSSQIVEVCIFGECEDVTSPSNNMSGEGAMSGNMSSPDSSTNNSEGNTNSTTSNTENDNPGNEGFIEGTDKEEILLLMKNLYSEEFTPIYELSNIIDSSSSLSFSDELMILSASISNLDLATKNLKQLNSRLINAKKNKDISSESLKAAAEKLRCAFKGDNRVLKKITKIREDSINKSEISEANITLLSKLKLSLINALNCKKAAVQIIDGANLFPENGVKELNALEEQLAEDASNPN